MPALDYEEVHMNGRSSYPKLMEPGYFGSLELPNRIVMSPMGTLFPGEWGEVTDTLVNYHVRRARGGAGMISTEICHVGTSIDPLRTLARVLRIDDDLYIPGMATLTEAVHQAGAYIAIEITAGGGTQASAGPWMPGLAEVETLPQASPSGIPSLVYPDKKTRALTADEVVRMVESFARGAARAKQAGFDAIEIHAHQGYLIAQFMSPYFNKRKDRYGGSPEGRLRFLLEIVEATRAKVGPSFPLGVRYSIDEYIEGGLELKEGLDIARKLEAAGIDDIHVACGVYGSKLTVTAPMYHPPGYMVHLAQAVKQVVKKTTVTVSGRLSDPDFAEQVLSDGKADFIAMGRGLLADPDLPNKVATGRVNEIRKCVYCNECRENLFRVYPIRCTVNPVMGREAQYDKLRPAETQKKVVVVGAGPGGMSAARVAALRGHRVVLCDRDAELGGLLKMASAPPHKDTYQSVIEYYRAELRKLPNVELKLGHNATADWILGQKPDAVIIACGAKQSLPQIAGAPAHRVVSAFDVLAEKATAGDRVIINKGGLFGCETANYLARQGKKVTVVEAGAVGATDMERWSWIALSGELKEAGVEILTRSSIKSVVSEGVLAVTVAGADGAEKVVLADRLVLVPELAPSSALAKELTGKVPLVRVVGDARQPRRSRDAITEGYVVGFDL